MKNLVKLLPLLATMALVSCKKDQTADQLIVEENVEATAALEASAPAPEAVAVAAAAGPATTVALSESNFAFGKIKKGDKVEHVYEVTNIDYYIDENFDEDIVEEFMDFMKNSESDSMKTLLAEYGDDLTDEEVRILRIKFISDVAN